MSATDIRVQKALQGLAERGELVEAGFAVLRSMTIPADAPKFHVDAMRTAFYAGASHVFHAMMIMPDPGAETTNADMARMSGLSAELAKYEAAFAQKLPTRGTA